MKPRLQGKCSPGPLLRCVVTACAILITFSPSWAKTEQWKEEVLLHDGGRIVVLRERSYGGPIFPPAYPGQRQVFGEKWVINFPSGASVTWSNPWGLEPTKANLALMIVDIVKGTPYIAALPAGCISYNRWERPNPPYVFQRYRRERWEQIELRDFPSELKLANVVVNEPLERYRASGFIDARKIREINARAPEYERVLIRQPIVFGPGNMGAECPVMKWNGSGWSTPKATPNRP